MSKELSKILYLPHGGGPLPLLGDPGHTEMVNFLQNISPALGSPKAILMISAHWEEEIVTIQTGAQPKLYFDYYGFPEETYKIEYPAPGEPALARRVEQLLNEHSIKTGHNAERGFDHGMFIPLMLIYPKANIPCIQLSQLQNLSPREHIDIGKALAPLREEGVLIIGSGLSFHNYQENCSQGEDFEFDRWLQDTCTNPQFDATEREQRLINWEQAPCARVCHAREEHLLPLHVCFGAAMGSSPRANLVFDHKVMGRKVSGFLW